MLGSKLFKAEAHASKDYSKVIGSQLLKGKDINKYIKGTELNIDNIKGSIQYILEDPESIRKQETFEQLNERVEEIHKYREEN